MPDLSIDWAQLLGAAASHAIRIILILTLAWVADRLAQRLIHRLMESRLTRVALEVKEELATRTATLEHLVARSATVVIFAMALLMVLSELSLNITALLASVGLAGLAVGFAAQSLVKDIINGFIIFAEDWYRKGEVAIVAGIGGLVEDVTLRRTVLRDLDGVMHSIPNGHIDIASNMTRGWSRINLNVSVSYNEDLDRVMQVINEVGQEMADDPELSPKLLSTPKALRVDKLGDSGIEIKILAECKPITQWDLTGELRKRLKRRFDEEGIEIPWPHTKVYFGNPLEFQGSRVGQVEARPRSE